MKKKPAHAELSGSRYLALQKLARAQGRTTAEVLQLYVLEGFLRRLAQSAHRDKLVLKGGVLMAAFDLRRATRDIDLLALRTPNEPKEVERLVVEVTSVPANDGVVFQPEGASSGPIRDADAYPGVRVAMAARIATAQMTLSVDLNVGDPVVPGPVLTNVPVLLGGERIDVLAYPRAMVVAEKLVTALQRGRASTRWRDFADLFVLVPGDLVGADVVSALRTVAKHRGASLQPLSEVLAGMPGEAQPRWAAWRERQGAQGRVPEDFAGVLRALEQHTRGWLLEAARP